MNSLANAYDSENSNQIDNVLDRLSRLIHIDRMSKSTKPTIKAKLDNQVYSLSIVKL
jgi:hypothetical protein